MIKIDNLYSLASVEDIIQRLRSEYPIFHDVQVTGDNIMVTCPFHGGGTEQNPSMGIYRKDGKDVELGTAHCFACGYTGSIKTIIEDYFCQQSGYADDYLLKNFETYAQINPREIKLIDREVEKQLDPYEFHFTQTYGDYLLQRGITEDTAKDFALGYSGDKIIFPIRTVGGDIEGYIERSTVEKRFKISYGWEKGFYGYYEYFKKFPMSREVILVEGVFDVLTLYQQGLPVLGLLGVGSKSQASWLRKMPFRVIYLCLDGDKAGRDGAKNMAKWLYNSGKDVKFINLKDGLDPADLTSKQLEYFKENYRK